MKAPETRSGLEGAWIALCARALASEGVEDEVLEALALASAVDLVPEVLEAVSGPHRRKLAARGAALLLSSRADGDSDEALARSRTFALARDGLAVLRPGSRRSQPPAAAIPAPAVAPAMLRRLLAGNLDGFAAAELARHLRARPASLVELEVLARHAASAAPSEGERLGREGPVAPARLRLVADDASGVRDPSGGETVGTARSGAVELEAIRFPDGTVAIYAAPAKRIAVPVLPTGVKVVRTALGYVELDAKKARASEVEVSVGSHRVTISIR